jgi:hypothetical protein
VPLLLGAVEPGALLEGEVVLPLLLEPHAATASRVPVATTAEPYCIQRLVDRPTDT